MRAVTFVVVWAAAAVCMSQLESVSAWIDDRRARREERLQEHARIQALKRQLEQGEE